MTPQRRYPEAWSYSAWGDYSLCPSKYEGRRVLKLPEPPSDAMEQGNVFHKQVAEHLSRPSAPLPERPIHARILPVVAQLRETEDKIVEQQWAFTKDWRTCGWFARAPKPTWLRVILDACVVYPDHTAIVGDWKTGKRYDSNDEQMELFALATFAHLPHVSFVETRLWYVDNGHEEIAEFSKGEEMSLRAKWEARAQIMLSDRTFAPRPNDKCKFCVRARQAGGDCQFG